MPAKSVYLIFCDDRSAFFHRMGLGIFWECGGRDRAREFNTRAQAAKVLHKNGKHHQGWRVISERSS